MILLELLFGFLKVGTFTFGGGYAAVPLILEVVLGHGWMTEESLAYMIAVSESTPGPIMVNMATYIGSSQAGLPGALIATTAVVLPSFLIILLVMALLRAALNNPYTKAFLQGLKPCVIGLILATGIYMLLDHCCHSDSRAVVIAIVLIAIQLIAGRLLKKKLPPIALIMISALAGVLVYGI